MLYKAASNMIGSLGVECFYFKDLEEQYFNGGYDDKELKSKLDGFGYIQQEFDDDEKGKEKKTTCQYLVEADDALKPLRRPKCTTKTQCIQPR